MLGNIILGMSSLICSNTKVLLGSQALMKLMEVSISPLQSAGIKIIPTANIFKESIYCRKCTSGCDNDNPIMQHHSVPDFFGAWIVSHRDHKLATDASFRAKVYYVNNFIDFILPYFFFHFSKIEKRSLLLQHPDVRATEKKVKVCPRRAFHLYKFIIEIITHRS